MAPKSKPGNRNSPKPAKATHLKYIATAKIVTLKRNPQYVTPTQMESLKASILRDGFCVPILVRPISRGRYECISGNHRLMACNELGIKIIPCVVAKMNDRDAKRLAINLNTIHGEPNAELLAPFLAEMDDALLSEIHLEDQTAREIVEFDKVLAERLDDLEVPDQMDRESLKHKNTICVCSKCGRKHFKP